MAYTRARDTLQCIFEFKVHYICSNKRFNSTWHTPPLTTKSCSLVHLTQCLSHHSILCFKGSSESGTKWEFNLTANLLEELEFWQLSGETVTLADSSECLTWSSITAKDVATAWLDVLGRPPWVQLLLSFQQGLPEHVQVSLGWSAECTITTSPTATWEGPWL